MGTYLSCGSKQLWLVWTMAGKCTSWYVLWGSRFADTPNADACVVPHIIYECVNVLGSTANV